MQTTVSAPFTAPIKNFLHFVTQTQIEILHVFNTKKAEPEPRATLDTCPKQWAIENLVHSNPWELYEDNHARIAAAPGGDLAFVAIFEDAFLQAEQALPEIEKMCEDFINRAEMALWRYEEMTDRKQKLARGQRPADIARSFIKPLRLIAKHGMGGGRIAGEILLECTMPENELLSPDWVDQYTGEIDPEALEYANLNIKEVSDAGNELETLELQAEKSAEAFNSEDDLSFEPEEDTLSATRDPLWMEMQADLSPTDRLWDLKKQGAKRIRKCQFAMTTGTQEQFLASEEAKSFMKWMEWSGKHNIWRKVEKLVDGKMVKLEERFTEGEAPQDLAVIFLSLQNEMGFPEEYAEQIPIVSPVAPNLAGWLEIFGDEFLEQFSQINLNDTELHYDLSPQHIETSVEAIEAFTNESFDMIVKNSSCASDKDITRRPEYIAAFFNTMINAKTVAKTEPDGRYRNLAVEAGWDAYRESVSHDGNLAYRYAIDHGKDNKEAMKAFWSLVNKTKNSSQIVRKDGVAKIMPDGLILTSGRKVTWSIAALKAKNNELEFKEGEKDRIINALNKAGVGLNFVAAL
jgi:hypothetical protein